MRILIAGLGSIGRRHLRNLITLGEQDLLLYRTHQSTLPEKDLPAVAVVSDIEEALDYKPDGVIVANPTSLHLATAIPFAQIGCSILLEKPVSNNLNGVDKLVSATESGGGKVLVGYQFRFHPSLVKTAEWLKGGRLADRFQYIASGANTCLAGILGRIIANPIVPGMI